MIELTDETAYIQEADGSRTIFEPSAFQDSIRRFTGIASEEITRDITLAAEFAIRRIGPDGIITRSDLDSLILKILRNIGCLPEAARYQKNAGVYAGICFLDRDGWRTLLAEKLGLRDDLLDRIATKVGNTMNSIGADSASPALALELGKHFLRMMETGHKAVISGPPPISASDVCRMDPETILRNAAPHIQKWIDQRILKLYSTDVRIFPALRLEIRLTGIANAAGLCPPVLEMAMLPEFVKLAESIDALCLLADKEYEVRGFASAVPLKLILSFPDASLFARDKMDCTGTEAIRDTVRELANQLCTMLTRQPVKVSCF